MSYDKDTLQTPADTKPLILIADDQFSTAVMLERVFEYEGYRVHKAFDGISALDAVRQLSPDLILLDINMPGLNGFDVLKQLRQDTKTARIPTILITAIGDFSKVVEGLNLGADDYLRKPFHPQELLARAQSKLRASQLENQLHRRTQELEDLLYLSEQLSQYPETGDLLSFIVSLIETLVPERYIWIYHLDQTRKVQNAQSHTNHPHSFTPHLSIFLNKHLQTKEDVLTWENMQDVVGRPKMMTAILGISDDILGLFMIAGEGDYSQNQIKLFKGLSRQITLALRKSELYKIQQDYANHLEEIVTLRTTELESAQKLLIRSEKLASIGRIAGEIAHEIKNPLMPIRICLDNIKEDIESGLYNGDMEMVINAFHSIDRINYIVDSLRAFMGNKQVDTANFQLLDVNTIIERLATFNQRILDNIQIETNLSPLPKIMGNQFQLEQIFQNLSVNANDAMPEGGTLTFKTFTDNRYVFIEVTDTGCGISPEIIESMFEPFVSTKSQGNGLGLFISYGIVQKHGGDIQVKSKAGKGTTFIIRLPVPFQ